MPRKRQVFPSSSPRRQSSDSTLILSTPRRLSSSAMAASDPVESSQEKGDARNSSISQEKGIVDMSRQQSPATLDEKAQKAIAAHPSPPSDSDKPTTTPVKPVSFLELFRYELRPAGSSPSYPPPSGSPPSSRSSWTWLVLSRRQPQVQLRCVPCVVFACRQSANHSSTASHEPPLREPH